MRIAFRCEGDHAVGMGHVTECLALARALSGHEITFYARLQTPGADLIREAGFQLEEPAAIAPSDVLVASLLTEDVRCYETLAAKTRQLTAVFDTGEAHDICADQIIDYSLAQQYQSSAAGGVAEQLRGPEFALLDDALHEFWRQRWVTPGRVQRIFINQGGSDPFALTLKILRGLVVAGFRGEAVVVVGPAADPELREQVSGMAATAPFQCSVEIAVSAARMRHLAASCHLAVTAAGNTLYELCAIGIPAVVLGHHARHDRVAHAFSDRGAAVNVGIGTSLSDAAIGQAIRDVAANRHLRGQLSAAAKGLVDGLGCHRAATRILARAGIGG